jgi:P pilus assembly chaperone PapD
MKILSILSILCFVVFGCFDCLALRITPFVHSFDPEDSEKTDISFSVTNNSAAPMAFEALVFRRGKNSPNGEETLVEDADSFAVFPSQIIVQPAGTKVVRVKWLGNNEYQQHPNDEQAFRVSFEQFHVNLQPGEKEKRKKGSNVELKLKVLTSLYMTPKKAAAKPVILSVTPQGTPGQYVVTVENRGNKHIVTNSINLETTIGGKKFPLSEILMEKDRDCSILPGERKALAVSEAVAQKQSK